MLRRTGAGRDTEIVLRNETLAAGSADDNDLVIDDPEVSRRHFTITRQGSEYVLKDLDSTNGTFVNGVEVKQTVLPREATIQVGATILKFFEGADQASSSEPKRERFGKVLGTSPGMTRLFSLLDRIAASELTVLLQGETGTGKDTLAASLHEASRRAAGPFVVFDCSRVSRDFMDSELFGHVKGAFTGAQSDRSGAFMRASGGTLFIDEVGELPSELQPKLLRALEAKTVKPLGSDKETKADVRVISATNRDLPDLVTKGSFRGDLFFRLQGVKLTIPPLRERREDIPMLLRHFLDIHGAAGVDLSMTADAIEDMQNRPWPGNVRELKTVVDRLVTFAGKGLIGLTEIRALDELAGAGPRIEQDTRLEKRIEGRTMEELERQAILDTIEAVHGNRSEAARRLGISRSTLLRRLKSFGIASDED